jgi:hypothetical protein
VVSRDHYLFRVFLLIPEKCVILILIRSFSCKESEETMVSLSSHYLKISIGHFSHLRWDNITLKATAQNCPTVFWKRTVFNIFSGYILHAAVLKYTLPNHAVLLHTMSTSWFLANKQDEIVSNGTYAYHAHCWHIQSAMFRIPLRTVLVILHKEWETYRQAVIGIYNIQCEICLVQCLSLTVLCFRKEINISIGFQVPTAVVMKSTIIWDITPRSPLKVNWRLGETSPLSSGSKNKPSKKPAWKWVAELSQKIVVLFTYVYFRSCILNENVSPVQYLHYVQLLQYLSC